MIIEHDGVCYDTNDPQQDAKIKQIYLEIQEQYMSRHSSLGSYVQRVNEVFHDLPQCQRHEPFEQLEEQDIPRGIQEARGPLATHSDRVAGAAAVIALIVMVGLLYFLRSITGGL